MGGVGDDRGQGAGPKYGEGVADYRFDEARDVSGERAFGRLEGKVDALGEQMKEMRVDVSKLLDQSIPVADHAFLMNQGRWIDMIRGNLKYLVSLSIGCAGALTYLAVQWMNWLHAKLGGVGVIPPH